ncbi:MAG TPA: FecR family protein [Planctomycetota bacterium]|jgi:ferric-dicitrate binding protein FerR (iron transport regulator)|nr:FecR family protein [Planctomycetota bacterium]
MSVPCEEIRPDLEALLAAMTDGTLDAEGKKRLSTILREHPDARQFYLDYCQMHALLQSAHGVLQALEAPSTARRRRLAWVAAAAALLVAAAAFFVLREIPRVDASIASVDGSAWIVRGGSKIPVGSDPRLRSGDRLVTGPDSHSEFRLRDGSRLTLLDRTEAELGERIQLKEGTLRCDIRPQSRPLVLQTPHAEATIIGTEFELSAAWKETRLRTTVGHVRLSADGRSVDVKAGQIGTADAQGVVRWDPVCSFDFTAMRELPSQMSPMFCASGIIHTPARKVVAAEADRVTLTGKGLRLGSDSANNGLTDLQWKDEVGEDLIVELGIAAGSKWGLGVALSGSGFEGYRVFFAAIDDYPNGIAIDTIWPQECIILARDPRSISYDKDHILRVERRGRRIRVWIDEQLRIDTEVTHPLGDKRRRVFSLCNFGSAPTIRTLKVWKAAP